MSYPRKLNQQEQSKARRRSLMVTAFVLVFIAGMGAQAVVTMFLKKKPATLQEQKAERDLLEYRAAHAPLTKRKAIPYLYSAAADTEAQARGARSAKHNFRRVGR